MKICSDCKEEKPLKEFPVSSGYKRGYCRACDSTRSREWYEANKSRVRNKAMVKRYGITLEDKKTILELQNWSCPICGKDLELHGRDSAVDHCHSTEKVRGILCKDCNTGLGHFKDDEDNLLKAIQYLRKSIEEGI